MMDMQRFFQRFQETMETSMPSEEWYPDLIQRGWHEWITGGWLEGYETAAPRDVRLLVASWN